MENVSNVVKGDTLHANVQILEKKAVIILVQDPDLDHIHQSKVDIKEEVQG